MPNWNFLLERLETPLGQMLIATDEQGVLRAVDWHDYEDRLHVLLSRQYRGDTVALHPATAGSGVAPVIEAYFAGDIGAIDRLAVATGGTDFQRQVWKALRDIPPGETISYGTLAARIGKPAAVRAVGLANGANPIGVVVPCHRVIGANRSLTGYGGGLERKRWLLDHERKWTKGVAGYSDRLPGF